MHPSATDTIPRASIEQIFGVLRFLVAQGGRTTFDAVRVHLLASSRRRAPNTSTAMWTVARDVLTELEKLGFSTVGVLPRRLSDVSRLRETPCELSQAGSDMAQLQPGKAYDALLIRWLTDHAYFRRLIARLLQSPLFVPDVTNMGQIGLDMAKGISASAISSGLATNCGSRLEAAGCPSEKLTVFRASVERRAIDQAAVFSTGGMDAKRLIDIVQDAIVLPALLEAEGLPFDPVTFQHMLKCAQEFFCAAWTTSHPRFSGRVAFATCEYDGPLHNDGVGPLSQVMHHGFSYAEPLFMKAIREAYVDTAGGTGGYVSAYAIRAEVCLSLRIPLAVFARCLESLISGGPQAELTVYTELPFEPPPQGENYVELGRRRIGRLKLVFKPGD